MYLFWLYTYVQNQWAVLLLDDYTIRSNWIFCTDMQALVRWIDLCTSCWKLIHQLTVYKINSVDFYICSFVYYRSHWSNLFNSPGVLYCGTNWTIDLYFVVRRLVGHNSFVIPLFVHSYAGTLTLNKKMWQYNDILVNWKDWINDLQIWW
jgi:hypothetical protein